MSRYGPVRLDDMLLSVIFSVVLVTFALAQNLAIGYPAPGSNIKVGQPLTIRIDKVGGPGAVDTSISIGIASCGTSGCLAPTTNMGTLLYNGPYNPQDSTLPHSQSFAFPIPANFPTGPAQLNLVDNVVAGANKFSYVQAVTVAVNVV